MGESREGATIDHTECKDNHTFCHRGCAPLVESPRQQVSGAARIVFAFTPNSTSAERFFPILTAMFGDDGDQATTVLADYIQTAIMLQSNQRKLVEKRGARGPLVIDP